MSEHGGDKKLKIFMYPFFAMGHIIPYLITAKKLAHRGHEVSLIVPPTGEAKLRSINIYPGGVNLRPIIIPPVDGLPPGAETTNDVTIRENHLILQALDRTAPEINSILSKLNPDLVIFDTYLQWLPKMAYQMKIKTVNLCLVSPASSGSLFHHETATVEDLMKCPPGFPADFNVSKTAAHQLRWFLTAKKDGTMSQGQRVFSGFEEAHAVAFRTYQNVEGKYCRFLQEKLKKPVLYTGAVIHQPETWILDEKWEKWLSKFEPRSVLFCAFGSEAVLQQDELHSLLLGIELTNLPFLVALRPPQGFGTLQDALPAGFTARTGDRGEVHSGWIPQIQILNHRSIGCFITHCGYGSMWEGMMMSGCRLVALPHSGDQFVNAKVLSEDLRVAVEVERGEELTKEAIYGAVTAAMADNETAANLNSLRKLLIQLSADDSYFDGFVDKLRSLVSENI